MPVNIAKRMFYVSVSVLASLALIAFGSVFLFMTSYRFSGAEYLIFGAVLLILSVFIVSSPDVKKYWWAALLLTVNAIYFLARATGGISQPWLARIIGVASWLAALLLIYVAWHLMTPRPTRTRNEEAND